MLAIKSMLLVINIMVSVISIGSARILYFNDFNIFKCNISLNALVKPHDGHGI